jgi:hypothetical protein
MYRQRPYYNAIQNSKLWKWLLHFNAWIKQFKYSGTECHGEVVIRSASYSRSQGVRIRA